MQSTKIGGILTLLLVLDCRRKTNTFLLVQKVRQYGNFSLKVGTATAEMMTLLADDRCMRLRY